MKTINKPITNPLADKQKIQNYNSTFKNQGKSFMSDLKKNNNFDNRNDMINSLSKIRNQINLDKNSNSLTKSLANFHSNKNPINFNNFNGNLPTPNLLQNGNNKNSMNNFNNRYKTQNSSLDNEFK